MLCPEEDYVPIHWAMDHMNFRGGLYILDMVLLFVLVVVDVGAKLLDLCGVLLSLQPDVCPPVKVETPRSHLVLCC